MHHWKPTLLLNLRRRRYLHSLPEVKRFREDERANMCDYVVDMLRVHKLVVYLRVANSYVSSHKYSDTDSPPLVHYVRILLFLMLGMLCCSTITRAPKS